MTQYSRRQLLKVGLGMAGATGLGTALPGGMF